MPAVVIRQRKTFRRNWPSFLRKVFLCRITTAGITFLRSSGLPFLTVAKTMSPHAAAGKRLRRPRMPPTAMMYRFLAPVLSAQLMTAPTGRPREMRNLAPAVPPRPLFDILGDGKKKEKRQSPPEVNSLCYD